VLIGEVLKLNSSEVEDNQIIQNLIDSNFNRFTRPANKCMLYMYLILHCIPMFAAIFFVRDSKGTFWCIMSCFAMQLLYQWLEYMDASRNEGGLYGYFKEFSNQVDQANFCVFLLWGSFCIWHPESFIPAEDNAASDMAYYDTDYAHYILRFIMPFLNTSIVALTCIQLLNYFTLFPEFGVLVSLVQTTVGSLWGFLGFLALWVTGFTLFFRLLGVTFDEGTFEDDYNPDFGDYPKIPAIIVGIFQNLRNSIGDLATPHYKYWEARYDGGEQVES
jgi:hypothetical protein